MQKYLSVGTNLIKNELFREIQDSSKSGSIKPSGGFWLTEFNKDFPKYNSWVDYILYIYPYVLFYKTNGNNPFKQKCVLVTLKDCANIYNLSNLQEYNYLLDNYSVNEEISFRKLSDDYDGVYVDLSSLLKCLDSKDYAKVRSFGVNTLLLFNLGCIDYYHPGIVDIAEFDYEYIEYTSFIDYEIKLDSKKLYVNNNVKKLVKKI